MAAADSQKQAFINRARAAATSLWNAQQELLELQKSWNALDYGNTIVTPDDFTGDNEGLTGAQIGAVVFDTANAVQVVLDAGHATNVARIKN